MEQLERQLSKGINDQGLVLQDFQFDNLIKYLTQLIKWNKAYNLSGIKDPKKMVDVHLLDSLSIIPYVKGSLIMDVGTGAGLPGLVLAICLPEKNFILLDGNGKKTRFIFQTAVQLGLSNVKVIQQRVEDFQTTEQIDIVISRAFTSLSQFVRWTRHLLNDKTMLLAMKGVLPSKEIDELPEGFRVKAVHELGITSIEGERHLLEIVQVKS